MRTQKLMWYNIMRSTKSKKISVLHYNIDINHFRKDIIGFKSRLYT